MKGKYIFFMFFIFQKKNEGITEWLPCKQAGQISQDDRQLRNTLRILGDPSFVFIPEKYKKLK